MPLARGLTASSVLLVLVLVVLSASAPVACHATAPAHNVTAILSASRGLAEFRSALTATGLADAVNNGALDAVTVIAVDGARMAALKGLPREAPRLALSRHVLVGYHDDATLRRLLLTGDAGTGGVVAPTLLDAPDATIAVRIARRSRAPGRVAFVLLDDAQGTAFYVGPVHDAPRSNVSVLLVSGVMWTAAAAPSESRLPKPSMAPAPVPLEQGLNRLGASRLVSLDAVTSTTIFQAPADVAPQ